MGGSKLLADSVLWLVLRGDLDPSLFLWSDGAIWYHQRSDTRSFLDGEWRKCLSHLSLIHQTMESLCVETIDSKQQSSLLALSWLSILLPKMCKMQRTLAFIFYWRKQFPRSLRSIYEDLTPDADIFMSKRFSVVGPRHLQRTARLRVNRKMRRCTSQRRQERVTKTIVWKRHPWQCYALWARPRHIFPLTSWWA